MLDRYLAELSQYGEVSSGYPWFDAYWQAGEPRWPYIVLDAQGAAIGFALVNTHAPVGLPADFAMAEFYVAPEARAAGAGRVAAVEVLRRHPGVWVILAMGRNVPARRFWPKAIAAATAEAVEEISVGRDYAFRFTIRSG